MRDDDGDREGPERRARAAIYMYTTRSAIKSYKQGGAYAAHVRGKCGGQGKEVEGIDRAGRASIKSLRSREQTRTERVA